MDKTVIKVEDLSKIYQLGELSTGTLSRDMERFWAKMRGKEDPFLRIGETNDRSSGDTKSVIRSLDHVSFEIGKGDTVGIIGRNGAGKSTLLKVLSRVTGPTTGSVKIRGRIASLLEVGTGFHPELTGRENIFLNGAILGMRKAEIARKFDEIVAFAGIQRYVDTPVKRYSSGMYVRLAFSVAAHLECEIMLIDEVLAVGDAEFQRKCLGKMEDVSKGEGRTVLFVSHNMAAIQKLCRSSLLLDQGTVRNYGSTDLVIDDYLKQNIDKGSIFDIPLPPHLEELPGYAYRVIIEDIDGHQVKEIRAGDGWQIRVCFRITKKLEHFVIGIGISTQLEVSLRTAWSHERTVAEGDYEAVFREEALLMATGSYHITVGLSSDEQTFHFAEQVANLTISDVRSDGLDKSVLRTAGIGLILNPMEVSVLPITDL